MSKRNPAVYPREFKGGGPPQETPTASCRQGKISEARMTAFLTKGKPITSKARREKALRHMNAMLAVVSEGGKTLVIKEDFDPVLKRRTLQRSAFKDIASFYHRKVQIGLKKSRGSPLFTSVGQWWLSHEKRRQYRGVVFAPDQNVPGYFNLWNGFSVEPQQGDWSLFRNHILEVICGDDADLLRYVLAWMAQGVQEPAIKSEVAIVLRSSERGTGKSTFTRYYRELFGNHGIEVSNSEHLVGRFNGHLEDCCVLVLTEALCTGSARSEAVLKALITEDTIAIERKGVDVRNSPNYLRILMTSNSDRVVPAGLDERRFLVLDVDPKHKQDTEYFGALVEQMDNGGLAAMLHDLLEYDYSDIDLRTVPQTPALLKQKIESLEPKDRWLFDKLAEGTLLPGDEAWAPEIEKKRLFDDFTESAAGFRSGKKATQTELGMHLKKAFGEELKATRPSRRRKRVRCWLFPDLQRCRELFDERLGASYDWPKVPLESVRRSKAADRSPSRSKRGSKGRSKRPSR